MKKASVGIVAVHCFLLSFGIAAFGQSARDMAACSDFPDKVLQEKDDFPVYEREGGSDMLEIIGGWQETR